MWRFYEVKSEQIPHFSTFESNSRKADNTSGTFLRKYVSHRSNLYQDILVKYSCYKVNFGKCLNSLVFLVTLNHYCLVTSYMTSDIRWVTNHCATALLKRWHIFFEILNSPSNFCFLFMKLSKSKDSAV